MLTISNQARDYILTKRRAVYLLENGKAGLCCGNIDFGPSVYLGEPPQTKNYKVEIVNGIAVYVPKEFYARWPLTIEVKNFWGLRILHIQGWKVM